MFNLASISDQEKTAACRDVAILARGQGGGSTQPVDVPVAEINDGRPRGEPPMAAQRGEKTCHGEIGRSVSTAPASGPPERAESSTGCSLRAVGTLWVYPVQCVGVVNGIWIA
ncbi:unnamed protein product [Lampetra planeri]